MSGYAKPSSIPADKHQLLKDRYPTEGPTQLAEEWGVPLWRVRSWANALGVRVSQIGRRQRQAESYASRSTLNLSFLDVWTPALAYCLGYIYADGGLEKDRGGHRLRLKSLTSDEGVVLFVRSCLGSSHHIKREPGCYDLDGTYLNPVTRVAITSKLLYLRLLDFGLQPNKSNLDLPYPDIVPKDYWSYFATGYLDGDGSIYVEPSKKCTVAFYGTDLFLNGLRDRLVAVGLSNQEVKWARTTHVVKWSAREDLIRLSDLLYPSDLPFCLERKKMKLQDYLRS